MKKYLAACAIALMAGAMFTPGIAGAKPATKSVQGKTVSFANGKLKVKNKKGAAKYIVGKKTDCGYSKGQMGDSMPCSNLKKKKYMKKSVTVNFRVDKKGRRVAELVAVHL